MSCLGSSILATAPLAATEFAPSYAAPSFLSPLANADFSVPLAENFLSPIACN